MNHQLSSAALLLHLVFQTRVEGNISFPPLYWSLGFGKLTPQCCCATFFCLSVLQLSFEKCWEGYKTEIELETCCSWGVGKRKQKDNKAPRVVGVLFGRCLYTSVL